MTWSHRIARRPLLASLAGLFGIAVVGGGIYEGVHLFGRRYPRTPYDDLLDQIPDRESAAKLGRAALAQVKAHSMEPLSLPSKDIAARIRSGDARGSVRRAAEADIDQGRLVAIQGWLLPVSLAEVAVIAASVQQPS